MVSTKLLEFWKYFATKAYTFERNIRVEKRGDLFLSFFHIGMLEKRTRKVPNLLDVCRREYTHFWYEGKKDTKSSRKTREKYCEKDKTEYRKNQNRENRKRERN